MFNFLNKNKKSEPLNYELRKYFEQSFLWLNQEFASPLIKDRKILTPTQDSFAIKWDKTRDNAYSALEIISQNMQIQLSDLELNFYSNGLKEIDMGNNIIFLQNDKNYEEAAGLYYGKNKNGKYEIALDEALLENPLNLIATIGHELSHVKLLGEKEMDYTDEMLTDFTTVFFGLGIINANCCFEFIQQSDRWGYNKLGYLRYDEWAYSLALFAFAREEDSPEWKKYLGKTILKEFDKSLNYMISNEVEIFKLPNV